MHIRYIIHVFAIGSALMGGPSHAQKPFHDGYGGGSIPGLKPLKNSMNLLVVGDWGRAGEYRQREVAVQMGNAAHTVKADFVVSTGDNFYPSGVASVEDPLWKRSFEDVYTAFSLQEEWYPVLGNHDYGGNAQAQLDYSRVSRRWRMPSRYHFFERTTDDGTSILFVFLDTNPFEKKYHREPQDSFFQANLTVGSADSLAQKQWLLEVLQKSKARWKIVFGHHPLYSAGKRKGLTEDVASSLLPMLVKGGAHLYVAGHEHHLEHDVLEGGLHHFISGAGSEVRPVSGNTLTRFAVSEHGFLTLSINRDAVQCRFVNDSGRIVYDTGIRAAR